MKKAIFFQILIFFTYQLEFEYELKPYEMRCLGEIIREQVLGYVLIKVSGKFNSESNKF